MIYATITTQDGDKTLTKQSTNEEINQILERYEHPLTKTKIGSSMHYRCIKGGF